VRNELTTRRSPSSETHSCSSGLEIRRLLRNSKLHYRAQKSPPLSWARRIQSTPPIYLSSHFNFIPHLCLGLQNDLSLHTFRLKFVWISNLFHACYMLRPSKHILCRVQIMKPSLCKCLHPLVSSSHRCKYYPQHPVLKHPQCVLEKTVMLPDEVQTCQSLCATNDDGTSRLQTDPEQQTGQDGYQMKCLKRVPCEDTDVH
jgi:hypothetical protein